MRFRIKMMFPALLALLAVQLACALPLSPANPTTVPAPAATATSPFGANAADPGLCLANLATPQKSNVIKSVTMAKKVEADSMNPVDVGSQFAPTDTLHTVVAIDNAPMGTRFKAEWIAVDIGNPATCNTKIGEYEVVTEGTRNIDFSLSPEPSWPAGSYKIQISINGVLDREENYTVK